MTMISTPEEFAEFAVEFGRQYLSSGGPASRVEEQLEELAAQFHLSAEVYATSTGIFVTASHAEKNEETPSINAVSEAKTPTHCTRLARIKENRINLSKLCSLEEVLLPISKGKQSVLEGLICLKRAARYWSPTYTTTQRLFAAFFMGVAMSFPIFRDIQAAFVSGIITTAAYEVTGPRFSRMIPSSVFRDFLGCVTTLVLAVMASKFLGGTAEAYSIGGIILLVPGLALTTAISELADQNFVSGTAKLMSAFLTLLALGSAYLLVQEFYPSAILKNQIINRAHADLLFSVLGLVVTVSGFAVIFSVPQKMLPWAVLTGLTGWLLLHQFETAQYAILASFLSSFGVGVVSISLSRIFAMPSQVFSVPGILAMLPGVLALSAFRSLAAGNESIGIETAFRVTLVAVAIVFGLFFARIPFEFLRPLMPRSLIAHLRFQRKGAKSPTGESKDTVN